MSAQTRKHKIHGIEVEQVSYQGKWYTGVAARVQIAEQADPDDIRQDGHGYHVTRVEIIQMGDKWAYHCMVEYPVGSGVIRPGTDFIDLSDKAGIAKAETSAIGRALGLHGIAIEEGIASAEEMRRSGATPDDAPASTQRSSFAARPPVIHAPADKPAPAADIAPVPPEMAQAAREAAAAAATVTKEPYRTATPTQWDTIRRGCTALDQEPPEPPISFEEASALIAELSEKYKRQAAERQKAGAR